MKLYRIKYQKTTAKDKEMVAKKLRLLFLDILTATDRQPTADPASEPKVICQACSFFATISLSLAVDF